MVVFHMETRRGDDVAIHQARTGDGMIDEAAERRKEGLEDEKRKIAVREKEVERREERGHAWMLQQRLDLVRREHLLAEKEKAMRRP